MSTNKSTRVAISVIFIVCTILLGYIIINELTVIQKTNKAIEELEQQSLNRQIVLTELRNNKDNVDLLKQNFTNLSKMIPDSLFEDSIVIELKNYAGEASVTLLSVDFGKRTKNEDLLELPVNMSFKGSYKSFQKLLSNILYGERLIKIENIQLKKETDGLLINMTAKAFSTPE